MVNEHADDQKRNKVEMTAPKSRLPFSVLISLTTSLLLSGTWGIYFPPSAEAIETTIVVRAKAKDAMFIGTSMGGAHVVIRNADTDEILAEGPTKGSTGNRNLLMNENGHRRGIPLADEKTAKYETILDLQEPLLASIEVSAPIPSSIKTQTLVWLLPGKPLGEDGLVVELPGFLVKVINPTVAGKVALKDGEVHIPIRVNVVMMCGCPITPNGLWDALQFDVAARISHHGSYEETISLQYAGEPNTFKGDLLVSQEGIYELSIYAYDPKSGNTGMDKTIVRVTQ